MAIGHLEVWLTNRDESLKRRAFTYEGIKVEATLNDLRTAEVTMPMEDFNALGQSNVQNMKPLRRFLKVVIKLQTGSAVFRRPIFWGPIGKVRMDFAAGTAQVQAVDPHIYLLKHFFRDGDTAVDLDTPVNGISLWTMATAALPTAAEETAGFADPGIVQGDLAVYSSGRDVRAKVGQNVWQRMLEIAGSADGPDFDLEPIDEEYDPRGTWEPGKLCQLNTFQPQGKGADKTSGDGAVIWHYGWGRDNLENFIWEPDGAATINRYVATSDRRRFEARYEAGMQLDGMMEDWQTVSAELNAEGIQEWARGQVGAYGATPDFHTLVPRIEQGPRGSVAGTPWRYPLDFSTGTRMRVVAQRGELEVAFNSRAVAVRTLQANETAALRQEIDAAPEPIDIDVDVVGEPH